ncbi:hypothetical protein GJA_4619 [Janthinobacterium agaricidamnosum NBRC 102515 = DSM 9628]|uniref:Uncharacterized protein n=1 Tax=Janthinobacterium agaricidamnosum NBRC 102515 = DSM 9628 TaxID=1349767 RepID=W0VBG7_9BURK|nr:hypothetical protein GJA_4619 [Janthinobacterium agaricidamnosum NBRC 102515 = DSM 9628]
MWRRTGIFRSDGRIDLTTSVWWFQSARFHIDVRIPQDRPRLAQAAALASLPPGQLVLFGAQSGFAGITVVDGERCEWRPEIAFPAISAELDAGLMRFDTPDNLHEDGLDASYQEDWLRVATGPMTGMRLESLDDSGKVAYLIASADWAAWACGDASGHFPATAGNQFSLLRRTRGTSSWRIVESNHSWLENSTIFTMPDITNCLPGQHFAFPIQTASQWRISAIA